MKTIILSICLLDVTLRRRGAKAITATLNRAINEIMALPDARAQLATMNMQPVGGSTADMTRFVRKETKRWGDVIKSANVTIN